MSLEINRNISASFGMGNNGFALQFDRSPVDRSPASQPVNLQGWPMPRPDFGAPIDQLSQSRRSNLWPMEQNPLQMILEFAKSMVETVLNFARSTLGNTAQGNTATPTGAPASTSGSPSSSTGATPTALPGSNAAPGAATPSAISAPTGSLQDTLGSLGSQLAKIGESLASILGGGTLDALGLSSVKDFFKKGAAFGKKLSSLKKKFKL